MDNPFNRRAAEQGSDVQFRRASGECLCSCGKMYYDHPMPREQAFLDHQGDPFLHRLCNGDLVKL